MLIQTKFVSLPLIFSHSYWVMTISVSLTWSFLIMHNQELSREIYLNQAFKLKFKLDLTYITLNFARKDYGKLGKIHSYLLHGYWARNPLNGCKDMQSPPLRTLKRKIKCNILNSPFKQHMPLLLLYHLFVKLLICMLTGS